MPIYSSSDLDESNDHKSQGGRWFGRDRSLHSALGGGQVADILLWRNKSLSAAILLGFTMIWLLFEVLEDLPDIHEITIQESAFKWLYRKLNLFLLRFYEISSGENFLEFFLVIGALWMISVIGNHFSSLNLLFFCVICLGTLPALYEEYEKEIDHLISKGKKDAKKMLKKFDAEVLRKIPRGHVKEKKRI
ncbi:hypothetical protein M8C21_002059 [Ambrosia artemisiifolia]|uniref:Reticulon-like protein n=1 Tax=Ambrosia artemisiifolia TaxID=4212 RepID=A0AAD5GFX4_AMBAR|nr:hypothetical protein M8C21_002059 [Ambrosia artemisiifolia]